MPAHEDVVGSDVAGDGGVVVNQLADLEAQGCRIEPQLGFALIACLLVDSRERGALFGHGCRRRVGQPPPGQPRGQIGEGGGDVAAQFQCWLVVHVDVGGQLIEVKQGAARGGVPQPGVIFHCVITHRHDDIGVGDQDVAGLVAEQPDPPHEAILERARDHAGGLEGFHHRQVGDGQQRAQRRTGGRIAGSDTDEQNGVARLSNQLGRVLNVICGCRTQAPAPVG